MPQSAPRPRRRRHSPRPSTTGRRPQSASAQELLHSFPMGPSFRGLGSFAVRYATGVCNVRWLPSRPSFILTQSGSSFFLSIHLLLLHYPAHPDEESTLRSFLSGGKQQVYSSLSRPRSGRATGPTTSKITRRNVWRQ